MSFDISNSALNSEKGKKISATASQAKSAVSSWWSNWKTSPAAAGAATTDVASNAVAAAAKVLSPSSELATSIGTQAVAAFSGLSESVSMSFKSLLQAQEMDEAQEMKEDDATTTTCTSTGSNSYIGTAKSNSNAATASNGSTVDVSETRVLCAKTDVADGAIHDV